MSPRHRCIVLILALVLAATSFAPVLARQETVHGLNQADMDLAIDPAADFYRYANGGWLERTAIPADEGYYGNFTALEELTRRQVIGVLEDLAKNGAVPGSDQDKAVRLFQQGIDQAKRDQQGLAPIQPLLDEITAIDDLEGLHRYLQSATFSGVSGLFPIYAYPDFDDASMMAAYLGGPFLGLPARDYYFEEDEATRAVRAAYVNSIGRAFQLLGAPEGAATQRAQQVYDLEHRLAEPTLTREEWQDLSLTYNPTPVADLETLYPLMDWPGYFAALDLQHVETINVDEIRYLKALAAIVEDTPLAVLKDYLTFQVLVSFSDTLGSDLEQIAFDYLGRALSGAEEQMPLEERVVQSVNGLMGEAVGQSYVAAYFPPQAKTQIITLVETIRAAFRQRLQTSSWMTPETQARALEKLDKMGVKVGYPDHWRSYATVEIGDSYAQSVRNAMNAETRRQLAKIGKPVDRNEWFIPPQTVNAFYSPETNEIVFPAAFLQPPYFDYLADAATNFGGIGGVIGHEITHGFDLQGAQFDADGNLHDWWTAEDYERFQALNDRVAAQYDAIEVLPNLFIDGQITVTENVADMGGVQVAHDALLLALTDGGTPVATPTADGSGLTAEQEFFVAWATGWREQIRDEALETQVLSDPHAPSAVRGVQPLRNMDAFHEAFGIAADDPMYLPPEERIVIW
ncbi:MAG: M13 family metallopeptidase [Thermomicrobiales bacterium]